MINLTQSQREKLLPQVDRVVDKFGLYTAYTIETQEYVGHVKLSLGDIPLETDLSDLLVEELGYERNGLSAAKYHHTTGKTDDGSFRKVDPESPRWQWHVHVWEYGQSAELYSHYEMRPDLERVADESWREMYKRLRTHYRPKYGVEYLRGVTCDEVGSLTVEDRYD